MSKFTYNYTAPTQDERREIEDIKRKYGSPVKERNKLEELRRLDGKVKNPPAILGLSLGIVGTLIFGVGLTMVLEWKLLIWGIIVMAIGCVPIATAYPAHNFLFEKNRKTYGDEILKLSEELLNEKNDLI